MIWWREIRRLYRNRSREFGQSQLRRAESGNRTVQANESEDFYERPFLLGLASGTGNCGLQHPLELTATLKMGAVDDSEPSEHSSRCTNPAEYHQFIDSHSEALRPDNPLYYVPHFFCKLLSADWHQ